MNFRWKHLFVALNVLSADALVAQKPSADRCSAIQLRRADTLHIRFGLPVTIARPAAPVLLEGKWFIVGSEIGYGLANIPTPNPPVTAEESDPGTALGVLLSEKGLVTLVQRPPFLLEKKIVPLVFPLGRRGFQLIWGEELPSDRDFMEAIYYATFDGTKWSAPELIVSGKMIRWESGSSDAMLIDGKPVIAFPVYDKGWRGVFLSRRTASGWKSDSVLVRSPFAPPGVSLITRGKAIGLVYKDQDRPGAQSQSNLYLKTFSVAPGESQEGLVIRELGNGAFNWPLSVRTLDGISHVFWIARAEIGNTESIEHVQSKDWAKWKFDSTPLSAPTVGYSLSIIGNNSIALMIQRSSVQPLESITWSSNGFASSRAHNELFPIGPSPILVRQDNGTVFSVWLTTSQFEFKGSKVPFPLTVTSGWEFDCSR